jgi:hypothetical protein
MENLDTNNESFAPTHWRRIQAINGRGDILIGPDEYRDQPGAMVIAPPGVLLRAPEGGEPLTRRGWRKARWSPDRDGHVLIDQARPFGLIEVDLAEVVDDLASWAPEHLLWVASVVERHLRILIGRMPRDCHGRMHPKASTAASELIETRRYADEAFGRLRGRSCEVPTLLLDRPFARIERTYINELVADREQLKEAMRSSGEQAAAGPRYLKLVTDFDPAVRSNPGDTA